jgi:hypothetical protein
MDSKMECVRATVAHDRQVEGEWTGYSQPLDRTLLKKNRYLDGKEEPTPIPPKPPERPRASTLFGEKLLGAIKDP